MKVLQLSINAWQNYKEYFNTDNLILNNIFKAEFQKDSAFFINQSRKHQLNLRTLSKIFKRTNYSKLVVIKYSNKTTVV